MSPISPISFRVGMGYDVHRLVEGRELWIGGIRLEHEKGLLGHSDADVLIHAICDAILGAANMRDIGYHFPDTSAETEGMDSKVILKETIALIATKGYRLANIDATICAERPKMNPHIPEMLADLRRQGKRLAVVSNKFYVATQELCRHFFADTIEVAIGEHEAAGIRKKPAPDTVMEALRQLGVDGKGAVYVGDSDVDVMTARNARLPCISVLWGFRDRDFLVEHGATTFVSSPMEI